MKQLGQLLPLVAVVACSVNPFAATVENVAGDYTAHFLMTNDSSGAVDWIAHGATLTLGLARDGSTSGHLFLPGGGAGGADVSADLAGIWLLVGSTVSFGQNADTFVRSMDFVPSPDRLSGDHTFADGKRVRVVLTK